jgi:hypothetical protein
MSDRATRFIHWINASFTIGTITFDLDVALKILAFLFVTVPLGVIQWWNFLDRYHARKNNAPRKSDGS